jgi:hypothetical protein
MSLTSRSRLTGIAPLMQITPGPELVAVVLLACGSHFGRPGLEGPEVNRD